MKSVMKSIIMNIIKNNEKYNKKHNEKRKPLILHYVTANLVKMHKKAQIKFDKYDTILQIC